MDKKTRKNMKSFDDWFKELTSDTRWVELLRHYKDDTIKKAGEKVFAQLVADSTVEVRPMSENRKHVYNILCKNPGDKVVNKNWYETQLWKDAEKQKEEWQPVTWEKRAEYLEKLQEIIKGSTMMSGVPRPSYKEQAEEGLDRPKNMPPYPTTSGDEFYIRQRHIDYIKENYEPRTGLPLDTWITEEQFNFSYPNKYIMHFLSKAKEILSPKDLKLINVDDLETSYKNILKRIRLYRDELQYSNDKAFIQAKEKRIQMLKVISEDLRLLMETMPK